jgi:hypothetical protein
VRQHEKRKEKMRIRDIVEAADLDLDAMKANIAANTNAVDTTTSVKPLPGSAKPTGGLGMTPAQSAVISASDVDKAINLGKSAQSKLEKQIADTTTQLKVAQTMPAGATVKGMSGPMGGPATNWVGRTAQGAPAGGGIVKYPETSQKFPLK